MRCTGEEGEKEGRWGRCMLTSHTHIFPEPDYRRAGESAKVWLHKTTICYPEWLTSCSESVTSVVVKITSCRLNSSCRFLQAALPTCSLTSTMFTCSAVTLL